MMGLVVFMFFVSLQLQADEREGYRVVNESFSQITEVNQAIAETEDEQPLKALIQQKNKHFKTLLGIIRNSFIEYNAPDENKNGLEFLHSKISINRTHGNHWAVQRDTYLVDDYLLKLERDSFVRYLLLASREHQSKALVVDETKKRLDLLYKKIQKTPIPTGGEGAIYQAAFKNYKQLGQNYALYLGFVEYVLENPHEIVTTSLFQKLSLISAISYFNNFESLQELNYFIAPLRLDMGGLIVSCAIFLFTLTLFPFILRFSQCLIERFILNDGKIDNIEVVLLSVHKPLLYFVFLFGLDLGFNALFYKTNYQTFIEYLLYILYGGLYVWLLFNLTDSVSEVQIEQADKRSKEYSKELALLAVKVIKSLIVLFALTLILSHFGINVTAIVSTLGIGGLAFAMAAKDSLSNFFGGLNIMIDRIFKMGDWIKVEAVEGTVVEIGLRSTTIRTFDNALITMPNAIVSTASVLNWNRRSVGRRIKMHVGVTYESNMQDIRNALEDIKKMLAEHPQIASPKERHTQHKTKHRYLSQEDLQGIKANQLVFLDRYNDFSIDILIYCFSKTVHWAEWLSVKEDVLFKIADILAANHLEFAYPTHVQINRDEVSEL